MVDISIIVPVFNHEHYIKKAIDSILMQKGNYSYEVLIGEDCSQDNTREVLKKIVPQLPSNFYIYFRAKNMGRYGKNNIQDLYKKSTGRYLIVLEGDDFWTYEYKLQKQFEFLELHKEYLAVAHNTKIVDEYNRVIFEYYPECKNNEYTIDDFKNGLLPGQTTTILRRNYHKYKIFDTYLEENEYPGDRKNAFLLVANGRIACIQEQWSAYRHVTEHGSSFSARTKIMRCEDNYRDALGFYRSIYEYSKIHMVDDAVKMVTEQLYIKCLVFYALKGVKFISWHYVLQEIRATRYITRDIAFIVQEVLKKITSTTYFKGKV